MNSPTDLTLSQRHSRGGRLSSELRRREGLTRTIAAYDTVVAEGRVPTQAAVAAELGIHIRTVKRHWRLIPGTVSRSSPSTDAIGTPMVTALVTLPEAAADAAEVTQAPLATLTAPASDPEIEALMAAVRLARSGPEAEFRAAKAALAAVAPEAVEAEAAEYYETPW